MAFFLFILVNAALFIRPGEIVPGLQVEVYFYVVCACLLASFGDILAFLTDQSLDTKPIALCILGIFVAILIPPILAGSLEQAWKDGFGFAKVIAYFLLFVSLVNTPERLLAMQRWLVAFTSVTAGLAILCYFEVLDIPALKPLPENIINGIPKRLKGSGILNDPNEFCTVMAMMIQLSLFFFLNDRNVLLKLLWGTSMLLFGLAAYLTLSRGGFLALLAGLGVFFVARYGWRRAILFGSVVIPLMFVLFGGRATTLSLDRNDTSMGRMHLWSDWLQEFRGNLPFGKGMPVGKETPIGKEGDASGADADQGSGLPGGFTHLAHNSYVQIFADLGIAGGCLFVGAFGIALWSVYRLGNKKVVMLQPELRGAQSHVLAAIVAYCGGMVSLSICYIVPTYLVLAMASCYARIGARCCLYPPPPLKFDLAMLGRFALWGAACLTVIYVFVRLFINRL